MKISSKFKELFFNFYWVKLTRKHCLASKVIMLLGLIAFFFTAVSVFYIDYFTNPSLISIRSMMSSIFGYLFGDNILSTNKLSSRNLYTVIASIIAFFSLTTIMVSSLINIDQGSAAIVEIRNLLFSSVGFLISKAKNNDVSEDLDKICKEKYENK